MKKQILILLLVFSLVLTGCATKEVVNKSDSSQMANPASKFCVDQGYQDVIRTNPDGSQTGYCVFPDGKECEEWQFFRGNCTNE